MNQDELMTRLLRDSRRIAVYGASDRPDRDSHRIFVYLKGAGYDVVPVNPQAKDVAGVRAVATLAEAGPIDLVDVFRAPQYLPGVIDECIAAKAPAIWLQFGVVHDEAIAKARAAGIDVVVDRCIMIDHRRLIGG